MPKPSEREPRVGDMWNLYDEPGQKKALIVTCWLPEKVDVLIPGQRMVCVFVSSLREWQFNLFDLLSGDPAAWAEALKFAPETGAAEFGEALREAASEHRVDICRPDTARRLSLAAAGWANGLIAEREERAALESEKEVPSDAANQTAGGESNGAGSSTGGTDPGGPDPGGHCAAESTEADQAGTADREGS